MKKMSCKIMLSLALLMFSILPAHALVLSYTDLWDVSQGTVVIATSGALTGGWSSDVRNMFGGYFGSGPPDLLNNTIFRDQLPAGTVHWVEWTTSSPVNVGSFNLVAAHDGDFDGYVTRNINFRGFSSFNLYARDSLASPWTQLYNYATDPDHDLDYGGGPNYPGQAYLELYANITPIAAQYFRAEFVQYGNGSPPYPYGYGDAQGPRVFELDGYAPTGGGGGVPEPTTILLYGLGFAGAGVYRRLRRKK